MRVISLIGASVLVAACAGERAPSTPPSKALSAEGVRNIDIAYSPDGSHLSWLAPSTGAGWELWVGNADMTSPRKLPVTTLFTGTPAVWSPDGKLIAALANNFGPANVVVVPVAGGDARRVTTGAGVQLPGSWYPDGDRFSFIASVEGTIRGFRTSLSRGGETPLVPSEKHAYFGAWSKDGSHIQYMDIDGQRTTMWIADSLGGSPRQLTTEGFESTPSSQSGWSPDGKEVLYESRRTGTSDLWVAPIDGGPRRQLTRDLRNDYNGTWSSDGKWIAFISDRGRQIDVWVVPSAGGQEIRVTDTPEEEAVPLWRPGTHELTFVTRSIKSGVWSETLDGKETRLTPDSVSATWFNTSPDGSQINYVVERGGGIQDLLVMPVAGGAPRTLVSGGGSVGSPNWSPDGSRIVFISDRGGTPDVWVVDAVGGAPRQLVNWPGVEGPAVWSGDGKSIYFVSDHDARLGDVWKVSPDGGAPVRVTNDGSLTGLISRPGVADLLTATISVHGGQLSIARITADGRLAPVWERSNAFASYLSPAGDSVGAQIEQPDGKMRGMIVPMKGGAGRVFGGPNDSPGPWSPDGKSMLYYTQSAGASDLGVVTLVDGKTRRLTTTPENEGGVEWTPDGKSVIFVRRQTVQRVTTVDLTKTLAAAK